MREIKFRGKRFDNNHDDWIYGYFHVIDTCGEGYTGKAIQQQQHGTARPYSVQVHSESVGQYTGLKDKNGIEIYEGDIIKDSTDFLMQIKYGDFTYRLIDYSDKEWELPFVGFYAEGFPDGTIDDLSVIGASELIGNIYENPDLLEVSE